MHFTRPSHLHSNLLSPLKKLACLAIALLFLPGPLSVANGVYRSEDARGRITYSDIPTPAAKPLQLNVQPARNWSRVVKVIDGDTIIIEGNKRVRLLGINTPEVESRHRPNEPGGIIAKNWLHHKLQGRNVYLEHDQQKQDRYKRLLAHVYLPNGEHINRSLLEHGLAVVTLLPPNLRHAEALIQAQQRAERQQLGIWSMPHYAPRDLTKITEKPFGWQRYRAKVTALKRSRQYSRLIINDKIDLRIANSDLALFPPLKTYLNKPVEVRGWINRRNDHFSIRIHHPSALLIR
ncbi:thermonuclease family protein [Nitrosomonas sp. ANs5]|uniref:thermonuclease family protein n=1 Tax=Nitrosomonas sp. ANs5 TaxID=3423941 RepID=UPI003D327BEF